MASVVLLPVLVQIFLFYSGLRDPVERAESLWGKSILDRQNVVWQPGRTLKELATRFSPDARIYLLNPQLHTHWNINYYFYPRYVTVTMTNGAYQTEQEYQQWSERPSPEWLVANHFTHTWNPTTGELTSIAPENPSNVAR
jgi:hypothetical protein